MRIGLWRVAACDTCFIADFSLEDGLSIDPTDIDWSRSYRRIQDSVDRGRFNLFQFEELTNENVRQADVVEFFDLTRRRTEPHHFLYFTRVGSRVGYGFVGTE